MSSIGNGECNVNDGNGKWCGGEETEKERDVRIRSLFDAFDSQRTGYVDGKQIESGLRSLRFPVQEQYARELLEACDSNHDGRIDYSEFRRYMDAKEMELYKVFQAIDISHDGSLQPEELRVALKRAGVEVGDKELNAFVQRIDEDKNGTIAFSEWRDFLMLYPEEATMENIYRHWEKVSVDIGEHVFIPEVAVGASRIRFLVAGAIAGSVSRTATAPLDRLKVLFQVQTHKSTAGSIMAGMLHIYKQNGISGFFRGNGLNVFKVAPESAIKFYTYEIMKRVVVGDGQHGEIGTRGRLVAGGVAGAVAQAIIYPLDVVKTRLQCHGEPGKAPNLLKFARDIFVHEGPRSLYRGLTPSLLGIIPYAGIDLTAYESLKMMSRRYLPPDTDPGPMVHLGCGTISGALGATCVYPLQLIRTRLQAQSLTTVGRYTGMGDAFKRTFKSEGIRGFYKGLLPNMLKVVPSASITYLVYEDIKVRLSIT